MKLDILNNLKILALFLVCTTFVYKHNLVESMEQNYETLNINSKNDTKLNKISNQAMLELSNKYQNDSTVIKQILIELNNGIRLSKGTFNFFKPEVYYNLSQYEQNIYNEAENLLNIIIINMKNNQLINKHIVNDNDKNKIIQVVKILSKKTKEDISNFNETYIK